MDDKLPSTLVHNMINHFNSANTALGGLCYKVEESQYSQMRSGSAVPHSPISLNLGAFNNFVFLCVNNMDKAALRQKWRLFPGKGAM